MRNRSDPQKSDPIRSGRIRVRSAAAVRYRFYVRSVLVAAAAICVAAGVVVVDRAAHPIRRATFDCWSIPSQSDPGAHHVMCAWFEYRPMPASVPMPADPIRSTPNA